MAGTQTFGVSIFRLLVMSLLPLYFAACSSGPPKWKTVKLGPPVIGGVNSTVNVEAHPNDSQTVFAAIQVDLRPAGRFGNLLMESKDGGVSWAERPMGESNRVIDEFKMSSSGKGVTLFGASSRRVFYSLKGDKWSEVTPKNLDKDLLIYKIAIQPRRVNRLVLLGQGGRCLLSENGGTSWELTEKLPGLPECLTVTEDGRIYSVCTTGLYVRGFDSSPWVKLLDLQVNGSGSDVEVHPKTGAIYVSSGDGIAVSDDHGKNWRALPCPRKVKSIELDPNTENTIFIGCYGGYVYMSKDKGRNWVSLSGPLSMWDLELVPVQPVRLIASDRLSRRLSIYQLPAGEK